MEWLTEDPTVAVMIGILIAGFLGCFGYMLKKRILTVLAMIVVVLTIGILITERYIITDREQIRFTMFDVAAFVANNRHDDILRYMDPDSAAYRQAQREMPDYVFRSCSISGINSIEVDESANPMTATINFVVAVNVNAIKTFDFDGFGRREVTLYLKKFPDGTWKIVNYSHQYPAGGAGLNAVPAN